MQRRLIGIVIGPGIGIGANYVVPMVSKSSPVYKARAVEFVVGRTGVSFDIGVTKLLSDK